MLHFKLYYNIAHTGYLAKILIEGSPHPVVVNVARGHTVTVYPETNPMTLQRILSNGIVFKFNALNLKYAILACRHSFTRDQHKRSRHRDRERDSVSPPLRRQHRLCEDMSAARQSTFLEGPGDEDITTTHPISAHQPPNLSELVTSTPEIGNVDTVKTPQETDIVVNVQSPVQSELVTGALNPGESATHVVEPPAITLDTNSEIQPIALSVPFRIRVDDTDYAIVDYDEDIDDSHLGSTTAQPETRQKPQDIEQERTHAALVVQDWKDFAISGLKIVRDSKDVEYRVRNVIHHFFYPNNYPKPGLYWTDLFSNNVLPKKVVDESGHTHWSYENSTRATVPLFDWIRGRTEPKFQGFDLTDDVVRDTLTFQSFVLDSIMPSIGFNPLLVSFELTGMSILLQPPLGGISQVIHTDDYPECPPGEWVSIIFPCHQQQSTVFLRNDRSNAFGKVEGVKPFLNIGDFAAWSKLRHFGSGAEAVDASMILRSALFAFVHVKPLPAAVPKGISPVTGDILEGNRDESGEEVIHYGPDIIHWTGGLVPIIRVCVSCLYGVNYDYEAQRPSHVSEERKHGRFSSSLVFCTQCVLRQPVSGCEARVQSLLCQWCRDMESFNPIATFPELDPMNAPVCVVDCIFQSVLEVGLCTHGKSHFQRLPDEDALFVLFSHEEIANSCKFWLDFFKTYKFTTVYAPSEFSHSSPHWRVFWELFMSNSSCTRARMLCWIGAMIAGIGPVLSKKGKKLYHGGYPVFFHSDLWMRESGENAFSKMMSACEDGVRHVFNRNHFLKTTRRVLSHVEQTYWEYSMRCQCNTSNNSEVLDETEADHRAITFCTGPTLRRNVQQPAQHVSNSDKDMADGFEVRCTQMWLSGHARDGGC